MTAGLLRALAAAARDAAHDGATRDAAHDGTTRDAAHDAAAPAPPAAAPVRDCVCGAPVLADRDDGTVVRHGDLVAKAHASDTDRPQLAARLAVAAHPALEGILLPPLPAPRTELHGRPLTYWPHGTPVDPEHPELAPWEAAGDLLARLHRTPAEALPTPLPPMRGPAKAARALSRMRAAGAHPAADAVERAWATLPPWARAEAPLTHAATLCHGDLHLGQLVHHEGRWLLIDIDDLGAGDPAWDLARPAAWYAAGLLPPEDWSRFLGAYRAGGGPAVPADGDPWPALDIPAKALTVQTAALAVAKAVREGRALDEVEEAVVQSCDRIAALPAELS
ncbi:aminoglycoside phosphotransferase family protein [Streptomyces indicus]|uniref:Phosphotransferase enzyme family protein n=1 Tax=Streptomyces indicus TaxID=417292 RepID=A0A1G8XHB0_9ACTN|nr:aminoglycoside phosphotransferase family protein [Streptomyces indicus]SDJ89952.1 Phosphotransferase enzyme family protein [Streptomyces indicus]